MFSEYLDGLIQKIDGTLGVAVMGMDGISIEKRLTDSSINIESLAAEYTSSLRTLSSTSAGCRSGYPGRVRSLNGSAHCRDSHDHSGVFPVYPPSQRRQSRKGALRTQAGALPSRKGICDLRRARHQPNSLSSIYLCRLAKPLKKACTY